MRKSEELAIFCLILLHCLTSSYSSPVQCKNGICTVQNYQGTFPDRSACQFAKVACPTNERELVSVVADAVKNNQRVKVVSRLVHSQSKIVCPGSGSGVLISTSTLASSIYVNQSAMTVTADAGVQLGDLILEVAKYGLTLHYAPSWSGLSISGMISTGAHGSGLWGKGSVSSGHVVSMRLVIPASPAQGYARVVVLSDADEDLKATKLSIGVLGAISKVTFKVQPMFKRAVTKQIVSDTGLEDSIATFANSHEFGEIAWYPAQKRMFLRIDDRVSSATTGEGKDNSNNYVVTTTSAAQGREYVEKLEAQNNMTYICSLAHQSLDNRLSSGDGFLNDGKNFKGYPVVGYSNMMQTSGGCQGNEQATCPRSTNEQTPSTFCSWDPRANGSLYYDVAISIGFSKVKNAILDIKRVRDANPQDICGIELIGFISLKFLKQTDSYLGDKEDAVDFEFWQHRYHQPDVPATYMNVIQEIEQLLLNKYEGRPHWGKNRNLVFNSIGSRVNNLTKFLQAKQKYDPKGLFSSGWTDAILGISKNNTTIYRDGCAIEGNCICKTNNHCAPSKGYSCKQGSVYTNARVCHL